MKAPKRPMQDTLLLGAKKGPTCKGHSKTYFIHAASSVPTNLLITSDCAFDIFIFLNSQKGQGNH